MVLDADDRHVVRTARGVVQTQLALGNPQAENHAFFEVSVLVFAIINFGCRLLVRSENDFRDRVAIRVLEVDPDILQTVLIIETRL